MAGNQADDAFPGIPLVDLCRAYVPTPLPVLSDALDLWSRKLAADVDVIGLPSRTSVQSCQ